MKKNKADTVIKEKIESLGTLSGGIVFGQEEAWEKLQGRMERLPAEIIWLPYLRVAAILLAVVIGILAYISFPAKQVVVKPVVSNSSMNNEPAAPIYLVVKEPGKTDVQTKKLVKKYLNKELKPIAKSDTVYTLVSAIPATVSPDKIIARDTSTPQPIVSQSIGVVHNNDLGKENRQVGMAAMQVNNVSHVDFNKMPVLHINDIEKDPRGWGRDIDRKTLYYEEGMTISRLPFFRKSTYENTMTKEEYHQSFNPFRFINNNQIIINTQN